MAKLQTIDEKFNRKYEQDESLEHRLRKFKNSMTKLGYKNVLLNRIPFIKLMMNYNIKQDLLSDLLAGISVGMASIPQAMGYATMLRIPVEYGLYGIIFPSLIYSFLTNSMHSSCTFNIGGVLFFNDALQTLGYNDELDNANATTSEDVLSPTMVRRLDAIYALTCISGIVILIGTLCQFGILTRFNSEPHMSAVFASTTTIIIINQLPFFFGIQTEKFSGFLQTPRSLIDVFRNINNTNFATLIISILSISTILFIKEIINPKLIKRFSIPFPVDIFVLILTTLISYLWNWEEQFDVKITGYIPSGMPDVQFPLGSDWTDFIKEGVIIGVLTFLGCPILIKHFAVRHNYKIDVSHEMFGIGISTVISSGLSCVALGVSSPRFLLMESCANKTQLAYIFAGISTLLSVLFLTEYAEALPDCVVSAIIACSFSRAFTNFARLRKYWRRDKVFLFLWLFTYSVCVLSTVSNGILYGLGMSIFVTALRAMYAPINILGYGYFRGQEYVLPTERYHSLESYNKIKIVSLNGPLFYANSTEIKDKILNILPAPNTTDGYIETMVIKEEDHIKTVSNIIDIKADNRKTDSSTNNSISHVILDLSRVSFIDTSALRELQTLKIQLNNNYCICLKLAACNECVRKGLTSAPRIETLLMDEMYASIEDAIYSAQHQQVTTKIYEIHDDDEDEDINTAM